MKAIVYTSQTGHTQRYAQMLAERTGVPAYSLKEAGKSLRRGEEIFYICLLYTSDAADEL